MVGHEYCPSTSMTEVGVSEVQATMSYNAELQVSVGTWGQI